MKSLLLATLVSSFFVLPAVAQDDGPSPAALEQIVLSEQLIAAGTARKDPVLILAAIRLRADLGGDMGTPSEGLTSKEDALAAARAAAGEDEALLAMIADAETEGSRRMPICTNNTYGSNYCY